MNVVTDRLWRFDLAPFSRQAQLPKTAFVNVQTTYVNTFSSHLLCENISGII